MIDPLIKTAILSFDKVALNSGLLRRASCLAQLSPIIVIGYGSPIPIAAVKTVSLQNSISENRLTLLERLYQRLRYKRLFSLPDAIYTPASLLLGRFISKRFYEAWYWRKPDHKEALKALLASEAKIIYAINLESLLVAVYAARQNGARIVLDLFEYSPSEKEQFFSWRLLKQPMIKYFLKKYIKSVSASLTVSQTIAEKYNEEYGFKPIVVMNAPSYVPDIAYRPTNPERIRLIHHGSALRMRHLEWMIEALALTENRYTMHFMLVDQDNGYIEELQNFAERIAPGRVYFESIVKPNEIVHTISKYDIGFYLLPQDCFNHLAALPNKFFDFINAGLAVCIGPSLEMAQLTIKNGFGIVSPSLAPVEIAKLLNQLYPAKINQMKRKAHISRKVLNAENEMIKLYNLHLEILNLVNKS